MLNDHRSLPSPRILLIGSGRLARAILRTMPESITALLLRDPRQERDLRAIAPELRIVEGLREIDPSEYDILWIATADGAIAPVAAKLAEERSEWRGVIVIHSSGATSPAALDPLRERGARTAALHPNGSFTGVEAIPAGLLWSISASDPDLHAAIRAMLDRVSPRIVVIDDAMRPLYHAAASVASNYSVTLFAVAVELYKRAGLSEPDARSVAAGFITGSAGRAAAMGPHAALTGPIARGDTDVYLRQLDAVGRYAGEYRDLFESLAGATAALAGRKLGGDDDHSAAGGQTIGAPEAQRGQEPASK